MAAFPFPVVLETELVYELQPGHIEGWERVEFERTLDGVRILGFGYDYRYDLEPTTFVLDGLERALKRITSAQIAKGEASLGPRGLRVFERLLSKSEFESLEIAAMRGKAAGVRS
jgi:hypothetical protein